MSKSLVFRFFILVSATNQKNSYNNVQFYLYVNYYSEVAYVGTFLTEVIYCWNSLRNENLKLAMKIPLLRKFALNYFITNISIFLRNNVFL